MQALSVNYDGPPSRSVFDVRTRLLISLAVSAAGLYLNRTGPLAVLGAATFLYVLHTRRYKLIALSYALVATMSLLSIGIIFLCYQGLEAGLNAMGSPHARMATMMRASLIANVHIPFLRLIPSLNALLAVALDFDVQSFIAAMKQVRMPRILFLPLTVFCRFIPEFIQNTRQLRDAIQMRGFRITPLFMMLRPVASLRLTLVPLSIRALRMSDNLAMAAEMKRIGYCDRPTLWKPSRLRQLDAIILLVAIFTLTALVIWQVNLPVAPAMRGGRP